MLQNIKNLYGEKLLASDGEIGHVQDFYFDDQNWAVRYVIADTGSWLAGKQVLLSPHAFGPPQEGGKLLQVNLTRKQIEESPSIESHQPVSRQYEEEYHRHYGWPCYWEGGGLWGPRALPILETEAEPPAGKSDRTSGLQPEGADTHLRSTLALDGYRLEASDGKIGHVSDYMMDPGSWEIRRLVIKIGHWLGGKEVEIATTKIDRISYDESAVFVNMTGKNVEQSPAHPSAMNRAIA
jgi:hypothetical protein